MHSFLNLYLIYDEKESVFETLEHTLLPTRLLTPMYVNIPYCL